MSGSLENSLFPLKQFLVKRACVAFNWVFIAKIKRMQKGLALRELTFIAGG